MTRQVVNKTTGIYLEVKMKGITFMCARKVEPKSNTRDSLGNYLKAAIINIILLTIHQMTMRL